MNDLLDILAHGRSLTESQAGALFDLLVDDSTHPAMAGALLAALRTKGETAEEVRGMARAMRARAIRPELGDGAPLVDVVGTGGDGSGSFNLSTGAALLAAAAGARVAKHGNNAISSKAGSADLLLELGLTLPLSAMAARQLLHACGFTFLHAPAHHPVLKAIGPVRRALATRTVFNILGPLCHPAATPFAVIGAYDLDVAQLMAEALKGLPIERAFVVHGLNGWDEPTPAAEFLLLDVRPGKVTSAVRDAASLGLTRCAPAELQGGDAAHNARALRAVFNGERGAHRDALLLGAALALEVTGLVRESADGVERAAAAIDDGSASRVIEALAMTRPS